MHVRVLRMYWRRLALLMRLSKLGRDNVVFACRDSLERSGSMLSEVE